MRGVYRYTKVFKEEIQILRECVSDRIIHHDNDTSAFL